MVYAEGPKDSFGASIRKKFNSLRVPKDEETDRFVIFFIKNHKQHCLVVCHPIAIGFKISNYQSLVIPKTVNLRHT